MMCGAVSEEERFSGAVEVYRQITRGSLKWQDRGVVLAPSCPQKGDIEKSPALEKAYKLGLSL